MKPYECFFLNVIEISPGKIADIDACFGTELEFLCGNNGGKKA